MFVAVEVGLFLVAIFRLEPCRDPLAARDLTAARVMLTFGGDCLPFVNLVVDKVKAECHVLVIVVGLALGHYSVILSRSRCVTVDAKCAED